MDITDVITELKEHLRIDTDLDDKLLEQYLLACISDIELRTGKTFMSEADAICTSWDDCPNDVRQYIRVTVGDMYRHRENGVEKSYNVYFTHLLDKYVDYTK